jgi:selenocysteine lyase/cysteine desulfurase
VMHFMTEEFGNAGSRTHEYGLRAKQGVQHAREQVAAVVSAKSEEVIFTSGATESNNLALLGLAQHGDRVRKRHIITTAIEHKAVLEPLEELARKGFEVTVLPVTHGGHTPRLGDAREQRDWRVATAGRDRRSNGQARGLPSCGCCARLWEGIRPPAFRTDRSH